MTTQNIGNDYAVRVHVRLTTRDQNRVFSRGDPLIRLPGGGLIKDVDGPPLERTSIFLSELTGLSGGLTRLFVDETSAVRFSDDVSEQLDRIRRDLEGA